MNLAAILCEYNPFHNGHARHIRTVRGAGADAVVCIMSGQFVQRGEPAIMDKFARAEAAVLGGADLVIELPHAFAMSAAPRFARAGVHLAALLGADVLSFGTESSDPAALIRAAALCADKAVEEKLPLYLAQGFDYPRALSAAVSALDPQAAALLTQPNNILAVEYLRAMAAYPALRPLAVPRSGAGHNADYEGTTASASFIRRVLIAGGSADGFLPPDCRARFRREQAAGRAPVTATALERAVLAQLRRMRPDDFAALPDVSEGLENRLFRAAQDAPTLAALCGQVKTKRYTYARIRRIAMAAYTGLTRTHQAVLPSYIRVLAFNTTGRAILAQLPEGPAVITKPAAGQCLGSADSALFRLEAQADRLWALGCPEPAARSENPYRRSPVYLNFRH